jgi:hypothetical protein
MIAKIRLFLLSLLLCSTAQAAITDLKIGVAQIFDVQWYMSGTTLNVSGMTRPFQSVPSARQMTTTEINTMSANNQYFKFFNSTTNPGTYGMAIYNSDGSLNRVVHNTGTFYKMGDGVIFYQGNNAWGTIISTARGYAYGNSASFTNTYTPNSTQLANYTPPSSTTLAAGQTAAPALCCGGSSASFNADANNVAKVQAFVNRTTADSKVYVDQVGSFNTITIQQTGTRNNYASYSGNGDSNTVSITQSGNNSTQANYTELSITGSSNTATLTQTSTGGGKGIFATVANNSNMLTVQQKDSGSHYAEINLSGGNKTVDLLQQGSASHMAKITLSGQPVGLNLSQSGSTQQFYSINYNCATQGGCSAITVTQGQ